MPTHTVISTRNMHHLVHVSHVSHKSYKLYKSLTRAHSDFHTRVGGALSNEDLATLLFGALKRESEQADGEGEERAAKRAATKVTVKVCF